MENTAVTGHNKIRIKHSRHAGKESCVSTEAVELTISKTDTETLFERSSKGHLRHIIERAASFVVARMRKQNGSSYYTVYMISLDMIVPEGATPLKV